MDVLYFQVCARTGVYVTGQVICMPLLCNLFKY